MKQHFFRRNRLGIYTLVAAIVFSAVLVLFFAFGSLGQGEKPFEELAHIGDSYGRLNALYSGLAFAGVVLALLVQIGEFHLAERERREALATQKQMSRQQFFNSLAGTIATLNEMERRTPAEHDSKQPITDQHISYLQQRLALRAIVSSTINDTQMSDHLDPLTGHSFKQSIHFVYTARRLRVFCEEFCRWIEDLDDRLVEGSTYKECLELVDEMKEEIATTFNDIDETTARSELDPYRSLYLHSLDVIENCRKEFVAVCRDNDPNFIDVHKHQGEIKSKTNDAIRFVLTFTE